MEEPKWGVEFPGPITVNAVIENHPAFLCQTTLMADVLPNLALQIIHRPAGGSKTPVHIHPTNTNSRHQKQLNLSLERHLHYPVLIRNLQISNSTTCHPDMYIHILLFLALKFSIWMNMSRVARTILILIRIC
jgi:hypothetical protein